jgi:putative Mg2+ transporter-C (MgtC) family protein
MARSLGIAAHWALQLISAFLGAIIGFERRSRSRSAGLRTMSLISAGSTLFTLAGTYGFTDGPQVCAACKPPATTPARPLVSWSQ